MENLTQNVVEKLFLDSFLKSQNWAYLCINSLKFYTVCFYCMLSWRLSEYIETKLQATCFYLIKAFLKSKKRSGISHPASFSAWFSKKSTCLVQLTDQISLSGCFTFWDIRRYVYCSCLLTRFDVMYFEINLIFLIKPIFLYNQKVKTNI